MRDMRRAERAITDPAEIEAVVTEAQVCRLGLVDEGEPYIVPVCFGYRDGKVYVHSALEGRKLEVIRVSPRVCLEFEADCEPVPAKEACGWAMRYRSVIGWGMASLVEDRAVKAQALDVIMAHYGGPAVSRTSSALDRLAIIRIEIESWTGKRSG